MAFLLSDDNIISYLVRSGLWPQGQDCTVLEPQPGKNFNRRVTREVLSTEPSSLEKSLCFDDWPFDDWPFDDWPTDLLVKQEPHGPDDMAVGELAREWAFYQLLNEVPALDSMQSSFRRASPSRSSKQSSVPTAWPLHFDPDNAILVFPYLQDVVDLSAFYRRCEPPYPSAIASAVGETFARLHSSSFQSQPCKAFWHSMYNSVGIRAPETVPDFLVGLRRLTPETFCVISADALKFFRFYQRYPEIGEAIARLNQSFTPCCVVHDDPRFANFLLHGSGRFFSPSSGDISESAQANVQLIDWEKWKWGDPAYDLGKTIANYLRLWLESLPISANIDLSVALNMATVPLEGIQQSAAALVRSYLLCFPEILVHQPSFIVKITRFAGLGLLRQVQLWIAQKSPIGNIEMAITQVAKSLLCQPQAAILTVFGQDQVQLEAAAYSQPLQEVS